MIATVPYSTPVTADEASAPALAATMGPADWPSYNRDAAGSRAAIETVLGPATVGALQVLWELPVSGTVHGTPAVVGDTVYAGTSAGVVHAVAADTGIQRWAAGGAGPITSTPLVTADRVIFGDLAGSIYAVRRDTGLPLWGPLRPNPHAAAAVYSSAVLIDDARAVIGIASHEELLTLSDPAYPCCDFRGSVAAFDPRSGVLLWHTYLISPEESVAGSSGAGVWSTPTYDASLGLIFVSTGNNYSAPATTTSDAIIALDPVDGHVVWVSQLHANDFWNFTYPFGDPEHPDYDFGDSPQVFRLTGGRPVVAAGQKSGFFHLLDARTGRLLDNLQLVPGWHIGGLFADSATAGGVSYVNGSDWQPKDILSVGSGGVGHVAAIRSNTPNLKLLWDFTVNESPQLGPVAYANGVVYFLASRAGDLYALDAESGEVLAKVHVGLGICGPSISGGRVFVGTGDFLGFISPVNQPQGSLFALGLPGR